MVYHCPKTSIEKKEEPAHAGDLLIIETRLA